MYRSTRNLLCRQLSYSLSDYPRSAASISSVDNELVQLDQRVQPVLSTGVETDNDRTLSEQGRYTLESVEDRATPEDVFVSEMAGVQETGTAAEGETIAFQETSHDVGPEAVIVESREVGSEGVKVGSEGVKVESKEVSLEGVKVESKEVGSEGVKVETEGVSPQGVKAESSSHMVRLSSIDEDLRDSPAFKFISRPDLYKFAKVSLSPTSKTLMLVV